MTETAEGGRSPMAGFIGDFKALTTKQWIAIIAGLAISLLLIMFMGTSCIGFFIAAIVLYMVPHLLGVSSVKVKAVVGVLFVIIALLVGTFAFAGNVDQFKDRIDEDTDNVRDVSYDVETDTLTFYYKPSSDNQNPHALVQVSPIQGIAFGTPYANSYVLHRQTDDPHGENDLHDLTVGETDASGWRMATLANAGIPSGTYCAVAVGVFDSGEYDAEGNIGKETLDAQLSFLLDTGANKTMECLTGTAYITAYAAVIFFIILIFSAIMRSSAEKSRKKMEADGRLYPQGYGRCHNCGALVLPGEIECRKCGTYIDVPEELRVHKKDYFQCSGAEVPGDAKECPKCGAKFDGEETEIIKVEVDKEGHVEETVVEDVAKCPECGNAVPENAEWCPRCGASLKKKE